MNQSRRPGGSAAAAASASGAVTPVVYKNPVPFPAASASGVTQEHRKVLAEMQKYIAEKMKETEKQPLPAGEDTDDDDRDAAHAQVDHEDTDDGSESGSGDADPSQQGETDINAQATENAASSSIPVDFAPHLAALRQVVGRLYAPGADGAMTNTEYDDVKGHVAIPGLGGQDRASWNKWLLYDWSVYLLSWSADAVDNVDSIKQAVVAIERLQKLVKERPRWLAEKCQEAYNNIKSVANRRPELPKIVGALGDILSVWQIDADFAGYRKLVQQQQEELRRLQQQARATPGTASMVTDSPVQPRVDSRAPVGQPPEDESDAQLRRPRQQPLVSELPLGRTSRSTAASQPLSARSDGTYKTAPLPLDTRSPAIPAFAADAEVTNATVIEQMEAADERNPATITTAIATMVGLLQQNGNAWYRPAPAAARVRVRDALGALLLRIESSITKDTRRGTPSVMRMWLQTWIEAVAPVLTTSEQQAQLQRLRERLDNLPPQEVLSTSKIDDPAARTRRVTDLASAVASQDRIGQQPTTTHPPQRTPRGRRLAKAPGVDNQPAVDPAYGIPTELMPTASSDTWARPSAPLDTLPSRPTESSARPQSSFEGNLATLMADDARLGLV